MDNTKPNEVQTVDEARIALNSVLVFLRGYRSDISIDKRPGARELSEAITCLETGGMWMNRSQFAHEGEYTPVLKTA